MILVPMTHQTHHQQVMWLHRKRVFQIANQNNLQLTNQQKLSPSLNQAQVHTNQLELQWHHQHNHQSISWQQANEECLQCQIQFIHLIHWIDHKSTQFDHHHITLLHSSSKQLWMLSDKTHFSCNGKIFVFFFETLGTIFLTTPGIIKNFREQTRGLYPYLSSQNYPYGSGAPVNALLQQQDYRRSCKYLTYAFPTSTTCLKYFNLRLGIRLDFESVGLSY